MKVKETIKATRTHKNGYGEVLFLEGKEYTIERESKDGKGIFVFNELHTETQIKKSKISEF